MTDEILYDVESGIATLRFNRPEVRNAFGDRTRVELKRLLEEAAADDAVRCIVITGAGRAFAAGGDIKGMAALQDQGDTAVMRERMGVVGDIVQLLRTLPKPVVAAINGAAAGGGMNLALACDIRYAAESAVFSESFVKIGLVPDWGGHYLLSRIVGTSRALELMMLGERIDAARACELGIVNAVYPDEVFLERVYERATAIAAGPPRALGVIKRGTYHALDTTLAESLAYEAAAQAELFLSADAREGMCAFLEKRKPIFRGDKVE